ncbi:hypothetical protein Gotur_024824 [Gossypium turneri]
MELEIDIDVSASSSKYMMSPIPYYCSINTTGLVLPVLTYQGWVT